MSLSTCIGAYALVVAIALTSAQAEEATTDSMANWAYEVRPGDVLSITVWKEPDLIRQVVVRPDGAMSFPLAGSIQTTGKTVEQLEVIVKQRLERFIPDPVVTVTIDQIMGNDVYVIGQVNRPGQFLPVARIDVIQALSLAGGTSPFAQLGNIKILRRVNGKLIAIPFDYGDIEKGKRLNQNIILEPGDVVVVP
jgi:polysaccharide export outer membrane protein